MGGLSTLLSHTRCLERGQQAREATGPTLAFQEPFVSQGAHTPVPHPLHPYQADPRRPPTADWARVWSRQSTGKLSPCPCVPVSFSLDGPRKQPCVVVGAR